MTFTPEGNTSKIQILESSAKPGPGWVQMSEKNLNFFNKFQASHVKRMDIMSKMIELFNDAEHNENQ